MHANTLEKGEETGWSEHVADDRSVIDLNDSRTNDSRGLSGRRGGFFPFFAELRRRKVCRAATAYCVALWLICQVVEVVSPALGLPDWTLEFVIVLGLVGFPIALILAWLFEVTPSGLVLDQTTGTCRVAEPIERARSRFDRMIDCSLLLVAVVIGAQLAITSLFSNLHASPISAEDLYISRFSVVAEARSEAFSSALQIELQHELSRMQAVRVIVPTDRASRTSGSSLAGSVSITGNEIQVTAIMFSNQSGELSWSEVLHFSIQESGGTPRSIAKGIVTAFEQRMYSSSDGSDRNG